MKDANIPQYINNTKFYGFLVLCSSDEYLTHIENNNIIFKNI